MRGGFPVLVQIRGLTMESQPTEDSKEGDVKAKTGDSSEQLAESAEKSTDKEAVSESADSSETPSEPEAKTSSEDDSPKTPLEKQPAHKFQPHQAKIFNELLEKTAPDVTVDDTRRYKHPIFIDGLLAMGLLLAMAGFTLGAVKMYIIQEAKHDISERRFTDAIAILKSAPLPGLFQMQGQSTEELLDEARYLDAVEKLDKDTHDTEALKELDLIRPGSHFFDMANSIKGDHAPTSAITLQGGTEHDATPAEVKGAERPLLPESDASTH